MILRLKGGMFHEASGRNVNDPLVYGASTLMVSPERQAASAAEPGVAESMREAVSQLRPDLQ